MQNIVLSLKEINKSFGENKILKNISIDIFKGEFLTLLGESGCGKTTTLRIIAGLEKTDSGEVVLDGVDVTGYPPDKRNVNTVFQSYALFPHMNVYDNIAYGPKIKGAAKDEIRRGVMEMLTLVRMEGYERRMPNQLSGGQRQRIAIARALINKPLMLLLDEPLGALDQKLRQHMQTELKSLQVQAGVTFVYVTHDQDEALNMSDRLVVMRDGVFVQAGTPKEIYESPSARFVAEFVGDRNIVPAKVLEALENECVCEVAGQKVSVRKQTKFISGETAELAVHTDRTLISARKPEGFSIKGRVTDKAYAGSRTKTSVLVSADADIRFVSIEYNSATNIEPGDEVYITFNPADGVLV